MVRDFGCRVARAERQNVIDREPIAIAVSSVRGDSLTAVYHDRAKPGTHAASRSDALIRQV